MELALNISESKGPEKIDFKPSSFKTEDHYREIIQTLSNDSEVSIKQYKDILDFVSVQKKYYPSDYENTVKTLRAKINSAILKYTEITSVPYFKEEAGALKPVTISLKELAEIAKKQGSQDPMKSARILKFVTDGKRDTIQFRALLVNHIMLDYFNSNEPDAWYFPLQSYAKSQGDCTDFAMTVYSMSRIFNFPKPAIFSVMYTDIKDNPVDHAAVVFRDLKGDYHLIDQNGTSKIKFKNKKPTDFEIIKETLKTFEIDNFSLEKVKLGVYDGDKMILQRLEDTSWKKEDIIPQKNGNQILDIFQ